MLIHIGNNISLLKTNIIAIFDKKTIDNCEYSKEFIKNIINNGYLINTANKEIKSYILVNKVGKERNQHVYKIYTSSISSISLLNRKDKSNNRLEEIKCPMI